jgi:hypothetical protein
MPDSKIQFGSSLPSSVELPAEPLQAGHGGAGLVKAGAWGGWGDVGWRLAGSAQDVAALASAIDVSGWLSWRAD